MANGVPRLNEAAVRPVLDVFEATAHNVDALAQARNFGEGTLAALQLTGEIEGGLSCTIKTRTSGDHGSITVFSTSYPKVWLMCVATEGFARIDTQVDEVTVPSHGWVEQPDRDYHLPGTTSATPEENATRLVQAAHQLLSL